MKDRAISDSRRRVYLFTVNPRINIVNIKTVERILQAKQHPFKKVAFHLSTLISIIGPTSKKV